MLNLIELIRNMAKAKAKEVEVVTPDVCSNCEGSGLACSVCHAEPIA